MKAIPNFGSYKTKYMMYFHFWEEKICMPIKRLKRNEHTQKRLFLVVISNTYFNISIF